MTNKIWMTWFVVITLLLLTAKAQKKTKKGLIADDGLIDLHEDNWRLMLTGEWMIEFFAPWCPACKNLAPTWERFAISAREANVNVAKIDVTTSPSLSGRFFVTALPTIYHVKDGEFRQYRGSRDGNALLLFVKQQQWRTLEPISAWKKPDTIHMSILSYFFKLSHTLKDYNARLQDEYGLPTWGAYALFAVGTICFGAILGLVLVCCVDLVYPQSKQSRQSFCETKDAKNVQCVDDLADEIEDDEEDNDTSDAENEDEQEADEDAEDNSTTDGEKNSHSESEEAEEIGDVNREDIKNKRDQQTAEVTNAATNEGDTATETASKQDTDVRKRKPRKAD